MSGLLLARIEVLLLLVSASFPAAFAGNVVPVSGSGSALQNAVNAAAEGDTLLVAPGTYTFTQVVGKSLSLVCTVPGSVMVTSGIAVRDLAAGQRCVVCGFVLQSSWHAFEATNCVGSLRVELVDATSSGADAVLVLNSPDVAFSRCTLQGAPAPSGQSTSVAGAGLRATGGQVALYETTCLGGHGRNGSIGGFPLTVIPPGLGGSGVAVDGATNLLVRGSTCTGGAGGVGSSLYCPTLGSIGPMAGAAGGPGVEVDATSLANAVDAVLQGGTGGAGGGGGICHGSTYGNASAGPAGPATIGTVNQLAGSHLTLAGACVVREGQSLGLTFAGTPGDTVYLAVSGQPRWLLDLALGGVFLFGSPTRRLQLGTIGAGGTLGVSLPIPPLPAGVQFDLRFLQLVERDPLTAQVQLGTPLTLTILDSAF